MSIQFDKAQQAVVDSNAPKMCVIAGAGAGKTACLTARVRRLLSEGNNPAGFVCITFTNMAAQEMKQRLADIPCKGMFIGTIHSYAMSIMRRNGIQKELITPERENQLAIELIAKYGKHLTVDKFKEWSKQRRLKDIGYITNYELMSMLNSDEQSELFTILDTLDAKDFYAGDKSDLDAVAKRVLELEKRAHTSVAYPDTVTSLANKRGLITFNGLLDCCTSRNNPYNIEYLFVDEFQDVGVFEFRFLKALNAKNIFVVGDDYQCQPEFTSVLMADGSRRYIQAVNVGDEVRSYDVNTRQMITSVVSAVQKSYSGDIIRVTTSSGAESRYTPNHKCLVVRDSNIVEVQASELRVMDKLLRYSSAGVTEESIYQINITWATSTQIPVYSLEIANTHCYFGDDILTHNSIYSFKGADFEYFKGLTESNEFKTFKLENNYRSVKRIVDEGNNIISHISDVIPKNCVSKVRATVPPTIVHTAGGLSAVMKYLSCIDARDYGKWFVLVRSNTDAISVSRACYRNGIPAMTFKKGAMTLDQMHSAMSDNTIKILTIHTAKGLENDNVLLWGNFPQKDEIEGYYGSAEHPTEECRVYYVAVTRAKKNLVVVHKPPREECFSAL